MPPQGKAEEFKISGHPRGLPLLEPKPARLLKNPILLTTLAIGFLSAPVNASPVIEESFAYDEGVALNGSDGGLGFDGAWANSFRNPTVASPNLEWGELLTTGLSSRGGTWSGAVRPLGDELADAGLLNDGATLWFSVILDLEGQNVANADLSISLGSSSFDSSGFGDRENLASGEGIGITHSRARIQGVYWKDEDANTIAERVENNSNTIINGDTANGNLSRALIVGRIDWGADDAAEETLTLYAPGEDLALGDPTMEAWAVPALDQSTFNQLALQFKDTPRFDEIRFGATSDDVLPKAGGPSRAPAITSLTAIDATTYEITIEASASSSFSLTSSETLDFTGSGLVSGLTQGSLGDPGSVDTNGLAFTTDEEGNATIRFTSEAAKNFVWIVPPIAIGR